MEKKNKVLVVLVVLLAICVLGLVGYVIYDKSVQKKEQPKKEVVTEVEKTNNYSNIDVNSLGRMLFDKYSIKDDSLKPYVSVASLEYAIYSDNDSSYNTISNELRMYLAFQNVPRSKIDVKGITCGSDLACVVESVSLDDLKDSFIDLFGADKNFAFNEFENNCSLCKLEDNTVNCFGYMGCGNDWESFAKVSYDSATLSDNSLVVNITKTYDDSPEKSSKYSVTFNKDVLDNWYWVSTVKEK